MPPPQPYPGMYYQPMMPMENYLTHRNVWGANALGLLLVWIGFLIRISGVSGMGAAASFLIFTGGLFGVLVSTAAALSSKKTSDMQNLGLLIWAGILFLVVTTATLGGLFIP